MTSNFCEDQYAEDKLSIFHEKILKELGIPQWANVKCPFCHKELPLRSVRAISVRFNTRNLGDVTVEIFCIHCSQMDTIYFRKEANNIADFISLLNDEKKPTNKFILESEMYKLGYNNAVEKMISSGE